MTPPRAEQEPLSEEIERAVDEAQRRIPVYRANGVILVQNTLRELARKVQAITLDRAVRIVETHDEDYGAVQRGRRILPAIRILIAAAIRAESK